MSFFTMFYLKRYGSLRIQKSRGSYRWLYNSTSHVIEGAFFNPSPGTLALPLELTVGFYTREGTLLYQGYTEHYSPLEKQSLKTCLVCKHRPRHLYIRREDFFCDTGSNGCKSVGGWGGVRIFWWFRKKENAKGEGGSVGSYLITK